MIFGANIIEWKGLNPLKSGIVYLNSDNISLIQETQGGTKFLYSKNRFDRRDKPDLVEVASSVDEVILYLDSPTPAVLEYSMYPNDDPLADVVEVNIPGNAFVYSYLYPSDPSKTLVFFHSYPNKISRILIETEGDWILATGFWDDSGVWDDDAVWID